MERIDRRRAADFRQVAHAVTGSCHGKIDAPADDEAGPVAEDGEAENEQSKVDRPGFAQCHSNSAADPTHLSGELLSREGECRPVGNFEQAESEAVENEESRTIHDSDTGAGSVDGLDVLADSESCVFGIDDHGIHPGAARNRIVLLCETVGEVGTDYGKHESETEGEAEPESGEVAGVARMVPDKPLLVGDSQAPAAPVIERGTQAPESVSVSEHRVLPFRVNPPNSVSVSVSDTEKAGKSDTQEKRNIRLDSSKSKTLGMREIRERWENPDGSTGCRYLGCVSEAMYKATRAELLKRRELGYGTTKISNQFTQFIAGRFRTAKEVRANTSRRG